MPRPKKIKIPIPDSYNLEWTDKFSNNLFTSIMDSPAWWSASIYGRVKNIFNENGFSTYADEEGNWKIKFKAQCSDENKIKKTRDNLFCRMFNWPLLHKDEILIK